MPRLRLVAALSAILVLALSSVALAAATKVTGGQTKLTLSSAAATALSANHITATAVSPASESGTTYTFPISGGRVNLANLRGKINLRGGLSLSNGTKTVKLTRLTIDSNGSGAYLWALIRGKTTHVCHLVGHHHPHLSCRTVIRYRSARIARFTKVTVSGGTASSTVVLTSSSAQLINQLAGKKIVSSGAAIGTGTITPTFA